MNKLIFIAHSVYLLPEERKMLAFGPATLQTVGFSVPTDGQNLQTPLTEVFVRYLITTESVASTQIDLMSDGYKISLKNFNDFTPVLNIEDGGSECAIFTFANTLTKNGESYDIKHQVVFKDVSVLERTTICEQLAQFLKTSPRLKGKK